MSSQGQRRSVFPAAQLAGQRSMLIMFLFLFVAWLTAAEITEKQWKNAWANPGTIVQNGITENGDIGPVRYLAWPKGIPENQPARWAKQKKLLGITTATLIKRLGKPLREFHDCDGGRFLVYPDGIVLMQHDEKKPFYRVVGWAPTASKFEDYLVQWGC
jgi:hypothetical protein